MTRHAPARFVHPANGLTYTSLLCGIGAIAAAMAGSAGQAGALIAAAAIADTFDGRYARRFERGPEPSELGAELDSLTDGCTFGVAPVVVAALLHGPATPVLSLVWWMAAFVYVASALTRLGAYNVWDRCQGHQPPGFIGLPTPAAALLWSTLLAFDAGPIALIAVALITSAAMMAPIRIPRPSGVALTLFVLWPLTLIALHLSGQ